MRRLLAIGITLTTLLGLGLFAGACGGGGGDALTLQEFFDELVALDDKSEEDSAELEAEFDALGDEPSVDEAVDLLEQQVDIIDELVTGIDDLDAPDEAQDIQEAAVDAGRDAVDAFRSGVDEARDAETIDDVFLLFDSEELNTAFDAFDAACVDAEALAAENNIEADLNCGE